MLAPAIGLSGFVVDYHRSGLNFIKLDGDIGCLGKWHPPED